MKMVKKLIPGNGSQKNVPDAATDSKRKDVIGLCDSIIIALRVSH
jgi:hypothetical protein